jgi:hypothetical protein
MEMEILKRKISTFKGEGGRLTKVSDDLLMEILHAWEQWTGSQGSFYSELGVSQKKMAKIIGKAKKLKREGHFPVEEFKEIKIGDLASGGPMGGLPPCSGIEILWENGRVIRFPQVDSLVDFLKKVA